MMTIKNALFLLMVYCGCTSGVGIEVDGPIITTPIDSTTQVMDTTMTPKDTTGIKDPIIKRNIKYLALGDSYTIGEGVPVAQKFPIQLSKIKFDAVETMDVRIIATTGWTTTNLLDAISREKVERDTFDFITLLIGVNNQYQNKAFSIYENEFVTLIDKAIAMVGSDAGKVIVVSIPNYGVTPFAANRSPEKIRIEIQRYNDYAALIAKSKGSKFVNITDISELASNDLSLLADDKLHPSGSMYKMWVDRIAREVIEILK